MNNKIKVIILAAGKGTRMKIDAPKALAMLKGKPFLKHILDTIKKLDPEIKPIIVVGYKKEWIKETLGENYIYAEQTEQLGTGHAVLSAKKAIKDEHEIVLVISADQPLVSKETLERIIKKQEKEKPAITLGTVLVPDFKDWKAGINYFGRIVRDKNNKVLKSVEYKDATEKEREIKEVNPSIYAFDSDWLWNNINKIENKNVQKEYYLTDTIGLAIEQGKKVNTVPINNILEALQPNSKEELELLEKLVV